MTTYRTVSIKLDDWEGKKSSIWSASFCEQTGVPALWSKRSKTWVCQIHKRSGCVATFKNETWLDKAIKAPEIHPNWPTKKEIAEHKKLLKGARIYHKFNIWIKEPLNIDQWVALDNAVSDAVDKLKIKHTHVAGPLPEASIKKITRRLNHKH